MLACRLAPIRLLQPEKPGSLEEGEGPCFSCELATRSCFSWASPQPRFVRPAAAMPCSCLAVAAESLVYSLSNSCITSFTAAPQRQCLILRGQVSALWDPSKSLHFFGYSLCSLSPRGSSCFLQLLPPYTLLKYCLNSWCGFCLLSGSCEI